jgi:NAD(P)H-hydrate epimerase
MLELQDIPRNAILTPHHGEFTHAFGNAEVADVAKKYHCIVLLKGDKDVASNGQETRVIEGGNPGMTKGGTGDVLAGLIAALACKNDPFVATLAGSFINKKAGDALYTKVGPFFNATDLANQIPLTMKELLL